MAEHIEVAKAYVTIIPSMQGAQKTISDELGASAEKAGEEAGKKTGKSMATGIGDGLSKAGKTLTKSISVPLIAAGTAVVASASGFETSFAQLSTIADTTEVSVDKLRESVMNLSAETGMSASTIAEAAYSAISAGQKTGDALNFVASAAKLAKGGFTDVSTATDVLTTALNAYGLSADKVTHISDVLIETQNEGKTTVSELAAAMGRVIPTAAAANIGIEDLASQYVALTKNGIATAESTTYINSMLNELNKSGTTASDMFKEVAGVAFPEFIAAGHSTTEALALLSAQAEASGLKITDAFGSAEAGKAANVLVSHAADANTALMNMQTTAGQTQAAFETMNNTTAQKFEIMKTSLQNLAITIGESVIPVIQPVIAKISEIFTALSEKWKALDPQMQELIVKIGAIAIAVGPLLSLGGKLLTGIGSAITAVNTIVKVITQLGSVITSCNPVVLGIVAAVTAVIAIIKNWGAISEWFRDVWDKVVSAVSKLANTLKTSLENVWKSIKATTESVWNAIQTFVTGVWDGLKTAVTNAANAIGNAVKSVWDSITSWTSNAWNTVKSTVIGVWDAIQNAFSSAWQTMTNIGRNIVEGIWNGISGSFTWIKNKITGWVGDVTGFFKRILGIKSPSKVFEEEVGKYIGLGVSAGIEDTIPAVERSMAEMAGSITPTFSVSGSMEAPTQQRGVVINVYGAEGQNVEALAQIVMDKIQFAVNQREGVFA